VEENKKARKPVFRKINKGFKKAFRWDPVDKASFVDFLQERGWRVVLSNTESDLQIALNYRPGEVVVTIDSDLLIYGNITIIWRAISKDRFLVYNVAEMLAALGMTRAQFTALGIVSTNDYDKNVPSLGAATNFSLVKSLKTSDVKGIVQQYLEHPQVVINNKEKTSFQLSFKVFVDLKQEILESASASDTSSVVKSLQEQYRQLLLQYKLQRQQTSKSFQGMQKHTRSQTFNRYRVIDGTWMLRSRQEPAPHPKSIDQPDSEDGAASLEGHPALTRTRTPRIRPRYSFKTRKRRKLHDPPKGMKQYAWKPYKTVPEAPSDEADPGDPNGKDPKITSASGETSSSPASNAAGTSASTPTLVKATASGNHNKKKSTAKPKKATSKKDKEKKDDRGVVSGRTTAIRRMDKEHPISTLDVGTALANVKAATKDENEGDLLAQEVMRCLEEVSRLAANTKRKCQVLVGKYIETVTAQDTVSPTDRVLLDLICPRDTNGNDNDDGGDEEDDTGKGCQLRFLRVLLNFLHTGKLPSSTTKFGPAVAQLIARTKELGLFKDLDLASDETGHEARYPAKHLLDSVGSELATPLTSIKQPFVGFSEHQLLNIFFKNPVLQKKIRQLIGPKTYTPSQVDAINWLNEQTPGYLLTALITPVGRGRNHQGRRGYRYTTTMMTTEAMRRHVDIIRDEDFDIPGYMNKYNMTSRKEYRYVLRGYIRTDGFRLQILAYKLKELQGARFKRFSEDRLPPRLTTTVAGTDHYLREIRNVIKTPQDVSDLFGDCDPKQIKVLALDLGQAFVLAANAWIPDPTTSDPSAKPTPESYHNLTINQKAVMQPTFAFRRWMESAKSELPEGASQSVSEIGSGLPPLRGHEGSIIQYSAALENVEGTLDKFYNGQGAFKRHAWDSRKAKEAEYAVITDRLLNVVGGSIGEKRKADNHVIIAIGLGSFNPSSGLSSLHGTFRKFFINKRR
ncbi:hypothetical protein BGZ72_010482, partial [Mortierella alpina]